MTEDDEKLKRIVPYKFLRDDDKIELVMKAFRIVFEDSIGIKSTNVRRGPSSNMVYVPKKIDEIDTEGCVCTIIVWPRKDIYVKEGQVKGEEAKP